MQIPINTLPLAKKKNAFVFLQLKCSHNFIQTKLEQHIYSLKKQFNLMSQLFIRTI